MDFFIFTGLILFIYSVLLYNYRKRIKKNGSKTLKIVFKVLLTIFWVLLLAFLFALVAIVFVTLEDPI